MPTAAQNAASNADTIATACSATHPMAGWIPGIQATRNDELLNSWQFDSLLEARVIIEDWRGDDNANRPHSASAKHSNRVRLRVMHDPPTPSRLATGAPDGLLRTTRRRGPGKGNTNMADGLTPHFEEVQAHYDLSDDFFRLFLDPTQTYTCAYFLGEDMTLEEAQIAKIDLSLSKLGLQPGMTLLDIGCGWGSAMRRALEKCDVNVIGLTLSKNQAAYVEQLLALSDSPRSKRVLLEGWERFDEPVDRIVAIGPFEHVGYDRYAAFFKRAYELLPGDGTMLLHTITVLSEKEIIESGLPLTMEIVEFSDFMKTEIFPGGFLPTIQMVKEHSAKAGFKLKRRQSLQRHYAKTLDIWAASLEAHKSEAIAIQSEEVYERYMKYLTGCADLFRKGYTDLNQFTLRK
jgi:cyclopropane-fatty-acyl-phospholipid synthase